MEAKKGKAIRNCCVLIGVICLMQGCSIEKTDGNKVQDLEFTVVTEDKIPQELAQSIEEQKAADFKLTYASGEKLYIARGYGEQETGGYSIAVEDVYLTKNAICFDTTLIGPKENEEVKKAPSFPYIVVEVGVKDKNVLFE